MLGIADLHTHSRASDGLGSLGSMIEYAENRANLDVMCITDHDDISPGLFARDLASKRGYKCDIVPGMEITTLNGHLIAIFLEKPVKSMRPLQSTIESVHNLGGLCIIPHPYSRLTYSIGESDLQRLYRQRIKEAMPDAIESQNPTPAGQAVRKHPKRLAWWAERGLAEVGGSDAHFVQSIGQAFTLFQGKTALELKKEIESRQTIAGLVPSEERNPITDN
jgi:predicted metal-dependent phosphoesterase TrpH